MRLPEKLSHCLTRVVKERDEHFYFEGARIEGKTQIGQATARLLQFNIPNRVLQRQILVIQQKYP
jgi:hypothetical protein